MEKYRKICEIMCTLFVSICVGVATNSFFAQPPNYLIGVATIVGGLIFFIFQIYLCFISTEADIYYKKK